MNGKIEIEARLDRSLEHQLEAAPLDRRFNAAVWDRIAEQESRARGTSSKSRSARWLLVSNALGFASSALLVIYFGIKVFGAMSFDVELPRLSSASSEIEWLLRWLPAVAALLIGIAFSPLGRRLRSELL